MAIPEKIRQMEEQIRGSVEQAVDGLRGGLRERVDQYYKQLVQTLEDVRTDLPAAFLKEGDLSSLIGRAVDDAMAEARTRASLEAAHGTAALRDGLARIDAARSQATVLEALQEATAAFAGRSMIFLVRQDALQGWGQRGFEGDDHDPSRVSFSAGDGVDWGSMIAGGGVVRLSSPARTALASRFEAPVSDQAVAVPMILRDRTAAYLFAEHTGQEGEGGTLDVAALQALTYAAALAIETLPFRSRAATSTLAPPPAPEVEDEPAADAPEIEAEAEAEDRVVEDDYTVGEGLVPEDDQAGTPEIEPEPEPEEVDVVLGAPETPALGDEPVAPATLEPSGSLEMGEPVADVEPDTEPRESYLETEMDTGIEIEPVEDEDDDAYEIEVDEDDDADWRVEDYDGGEDFDADEDLDAAPVDSTASDSLAEPMGVEEPTPAFGTVEQDRPSRFAEPVTEEPSPREVPPPAPQEPVMTPVEPSTFEAPAATVSEPEPEPPTPTAPTTEAASPAPAVGGGQVQPPQDVEGPGWAFSAPLKEERSDDEEASHEEARRLARLLVSEIKLYNEEEVLEGRRNNDVAQRLRDDIERSRQLYDERVDPSVRDNTDYFYQEMVRLLGAGDPKTLGI